MEDRDPGTDSLAPALLLSMPQLLDPNFAHSVVLLCRHSAEGAFGLVVNRRLPTPARVVIENDPAGKAEKDLPVWLGGPVDQERSWILLGDAPGEVEAVPVADGLYLSTSPALLKRLMEPSPPRARLLVGYAGWGPGQLDAELRASAWLTIGVTADLLFETPEDAMWETALRRLGADPGALHLSHGVH
ncbi:MAG TPA: YqgE/AlgH family protein [Vicinamibacterales bacterium]|nr:YqgE/AlgH family protein [Vicinamibacterales bacterium]